MPTETQLEATPLRGNRWAVRPINRLGTCGWIKGQAWSVIYVTAKTQQEALRKGNYVAAMRKIFPY